ncbi:hypothetical protein OB931_06020 [Aeromonas media]|uniref:hypothetical protein n=1 Tax=Aeromonas media TaxID=651 RepID=UPI0024C198E4|nr:hypothetical protein [Aeromonas media]MDM5075946.1 hypothetical protein [Aeromonas media]
MDNEFICKAAMATVNYINNLDTITATEIPDGFFDLRYTQEVRNQKYKHGGKLKVEGSKVVGGFYDSVGDLTPMEQQEIEFIIDGESLFIISIFNGHKEQREFADWAIFSRK